MKKSNRILSLLLVFVLAFSLAACGSGADDSEDVAQEESKAQIQETDKKTEPQEEPEKEPEEIEEEEPVKTGLGPNMLLLPTMENMADKFPDVWQNPGLTGRMMLFSRLLRLDADLQPAYGDLADEWEESEDGLSYSFTLKDGIKWHDGEELTAEDVAYSIKYAIKCPTVNPVTKGALINIKGAKDFADNEDVIPADELEGVNIEDNVINIDMEKRTGTMLFTMAQFNILPKHLIEEYDPVGFSTSEFFDKPIGSGPYYVKEFEPNDYALLEVFSDYFGETPQIEQVKMTQMTQADYPTRALADEIDFFYTNDLGTAEAAIENPNYEAFFTDIYFVRYFMWNSTSDNSDLFKDVNVRRAFVKAIDRDTITESLMPGQAIPMDSKVPSYMPYYNDEVYDLSYEPEVAKEMLEDAGFDFSRTIKLSAYYADQGTADFMDTVCAYLEEIGLKAEWKLITGDIVAQLYETKDYDLVYAGLSAMTPEEAYNQYHSDALGGTPFANVWPTGQTDMDDLLDELQGTSDEARRNEIFKELQAIETEEMLWCLPMFSLRNIQVFNTARLNLPEELVLSNEWANYERYIEKWTLNTE